MYTHGAGREMDNLAPGTAVEVQGLKARPDLNGKRAKIVAYVEERERYQVKVDEGEEIYLRPANVSELPHACDEPAPAAGDAAPSPPVAASSAPAEAVPPPPVDATTTSTAPPATAPSTSCEQPAAATEAPAATATTTATTTATPESLEPGAGVEVNGLKARPDLNTKHAKVVAYIPDRERYHVVILATKEEIYLRSANLTKSAVAAAAVASAQVVERTLAAAAAAQAKAEQAAAEQAGGASDSAAGAQAGAGEGAVAAGAQAQRGQHGGVGEQQAAATAAVEEGAAEKAAILREASAGVSAGAAAAVAAATAPPPPIEEIKDSETLLKEFFADVSDATRDAEVDRILSCFKLNPYEHLNLRFDATEDDIRRAFRKVSLMVHPDKCKHPNAKAAFDAIGQAQQLLGEENVKKELDFNLERARESVVKAWKKETRNDVVLRVRFQGDRDAQLAAFLDTDEFHERWKLEGRKFIVDLEWRRRKLTLRIKSEEERVNNEEEAEKEERKAQQKRQKEWDNEKARETRVGGWRNFMGDQKSKRKKQKVTGEFRAPKLKKEERTNEEEYHGLDKNGNRVLRPDEVSKAW